MLEFYLSVDVDDTCSPYLPREQDNCTGFWGRMIYRKEPDGVLYEALIMKTISGGGYLDSKQVKPLTILRRL